MLSWCYHDLLPTVTRLVCRLSQCWKCHPCVVLMLLDLRGSRERDHSCGWRREVPFSWCPRSREVLGGDLCTTAPRAHTRGPVPCRHAPGLPDSSTSWYPAGCQASAHRLLLYRLRTWETFLPLRCFFAMLELIFAYTVVCSDKPVSFVTRIIAFKAPFIAQFFIPQCFSVLILILMICGCRDSFLGCVSLLLCFSITEPILQYLNYCSIINLDVWYSISSIPLKLSFLQI